MKKNWVRCFAIVSKREKKIYSHILKFFLADIFSGLQSNGLLDAYTHLLTGYIGKDSFLREIVNIVQALRAKSPNLIYGK